MFTHLEIDTARLGSLAQSFASRARELSRLAESLARSMALPDSTWKGMAATACERVVGEVLSSVAALVGLLDRVVAALERISGGYWSAELALASRGV